MNARESITHRGAQSGLPTGFGPKAALEAYTRDELGDDELVAALLLRCREDSDTTWEALSLLDQYHRRGLLETGLFLTAKTELNLQFFTAQPPLPGNAADRSTGLTALDQFSKGMLD
jgi:hypothetical protein